jgi:hypothetical protein
MLKDRRPKGEMYFGGATPAAAGTHTHTHTTFMYTHPSTYTYVCTFKC